MIGGFSISGLWAHAPHRASAPLRLVLDLIADGRLNIAVTEVDSLAETPAAQQLLAEGRGHGKNVTRVNGSSPGPAHQRPRNWCNSPVPPPRPAIGQ